MKAVESGLAVGALWSSEVLVPITGVSSRGSKAWSGRLLQTSALDKLRSQAPPKAKV